MKYLRQTLRKLILLNSKGENGKTTRLNKTLQVMESYYRELYTSEKEPDIDALEKPKANNSKKNFGPESRLEIVEMLKVTNFVHFLRRLNHSKHTTFKCKKSTFLAIFTGLVEIKVILKNALCKIQRVI